VLTSKFGRKKSPGGLAMEFTDYLIIKAVVLVVAAFIYGLWVGFTGR
jgi:hypothetical protein